MKKGLLSLFAFGLLFGAFGAVTHSEEPVEAEAAWSDETVRVYLDKTATIAGLGWWSTDSTYIHIWDGTTDHYELMTKVNDNLFYFDIVDGIWDTFIDGVRGMEFYVYDRSSNQNQTAFSDGLYLKTNELNYFKLNSANGGAKQTYIIQNKEVEETIVAIGNLTCASLPTAVTAAVNQYEALRAQGKTNLQTWEVSTGVTWYQRLTYMANYHSVTPPASSTYVFLDPRHTEPANLSTILFISIGGLTALGLFLALNKRKIIN